MIVLGIIGWLAVGLLGYINGELHLKRRYGQPSDDAMMLTALAGPFNLVTFAMFGWNLKMELSAGE